MPTKVRTREAVCPFATVAVAPVNISHLPKLQRHAATNADTLYLSEQALLPPTRHFTISPSLPRRIISLQYSRLRLIRLGECISTLFSHALHLSNFSYGFLELFHSSHLLVSNAHT